MTETFPEGWGEGTPAAPEAARQFSPDELAEAARQIAAQNAGVAGTAPDDVTDSGAALGMQALAAGAEATEVDPAAMLAQIRALAAKVAALEAEKRLSTAPDVVKYTQALYDHLAAKSYQHPTVQQDPDHTYGRAPNDAGHGGAGVLGAASNLVTGAFDAAESGDPGTLAADVAKVETWVTRHARRFPHIDYSYILELAAEAAGAVAKLAA